MQVMAWIPWLDIFLILLFVGLVALAFWQGLLRAAWFLISLYLAVVLASLYGDFLAGLVGAQVQEVGPEGSGGAVSSALGFFVVFFLALVILFTILAALFAHVRLRTSLLWLDKVGGISVGLIASFFLTSMIAYVLYALLGGAGPLNEYSFVGVLRAQRLTSPILRAFLISRPVILATIQLWLPGGLPAFLR